MASALLHAEARYDHKSVLIKTKIPLITDEITPLASPNFQAKKWSVLSQFHPSKIKRLSHPETKSIFNHLRSASSSQHQVLALYFDHDQDIPTVIKQLKSNPDIITAEPNLIYQLPKIQFTPNDPSMNSQYHISLLDMPSAWEISTGNSNITIAIIDTGIDTTHPDLRNQLWDNTAEINGTAGVDDDHNGKIDDTHGWGFHSATSNIKDMIGHGTHVSGIAAAQTNNHIGIAGVAYNCKLMPLKASIGNTNYFELADLIEAINYAIEKDASVINMSLGGSGQSSLFNDAISEAHDANISIVVAAGNEASNIEDENISPAIHPDVITVAAARSTGEVDTRYSNYGKAVDILATGTNIYSTYPTSNYHQLTGTSMATPIVSGVVALLKSVYPEATPSQIYDAITQTALDKNSTGKDMLTGYGLIQPAAALNFMKWPRTHSSKLSGDYVQINQTLEYSFISISPIKTDSIVATINQTRYTLQSPELIFTPLTGTYSGKLSIDFSTIPLAAQTPIQLYYEDIKGDFNTDNITLINQSAFKIVGPNGEDSQLINAPNPFDPNNESTIIGFEVSQNADISIEIYTLGLTKIFEWNGYVDTGYQSITWDGKDMSGDTVPNGIYIMALKATSETGESLKKRHKIAVSKRN